MHQARPAAHGRELTVPPPSLSCRGDAGLRGRAAFQQAGFRAEDARIERLRPPPLDAVRRFFRACDAARGGAVAVHCRSGRGRSAAMAGLWLMREYRLTAREATVWLRLVRPGPARAALQAMRCAVPSDPCEARSL
jgi:hypothetical protein